MNTPNPPLGSPLVECEKRYLGNTEFSYDVTSEANRQQEVIADTLMTGEIEKKQYLLGGETENVYVSCRFPRGRRDSAVDITTRCGLEGPEIEFRWGEIFRTPPYRPWGAPSILYNGYRE